VEVRLPGGTLEVALADGVAWLTGPVETVFEGSLT
jgi:diaminopimelate epimerase